MRIVPPYSEKLTAILLCLGVMGLNLVTKLWEVGDVSIYLDEMASIYHGQASHAEFLAFLKRDPSPPLYYWLLRGWMSLFGDSAAAVRAMSVIFSSLTAAGLFWLGQRFFTRFVGVLAALLFTFSQLQFQFAQDARAFALLGLLAVVSYYCFLGMLRDRRTSDFVGLMLANVLLMATHYVAVPLMITQAVVALLVLPFSPRRIFPMALSQIPLLIFVALFTLGDITGEKMGKTSGWLQAPEIDVLWKMLWTLSGRREFAELMFALLMGGVLWKAAGLLRRRRQGEQQKLRSFYALLAWPLLGLPIAWLLSQWVPFFIDKYLLYLGVGWFLAVAVGVGALPVGKIGRWAIAVYLLLWSLQLYHGKKKVWEDWKNAAVLAKEYKENGALIVLPVYQLPTFAYYYDRDAFRASNKLGRLIKMFREAAIYSEKRLDEAFFADKTYDRYLLVQTHAAVTDPKKESYKLLDARFHLQGSVQLSRIEVCLFEGKKQTVSSDSVEVEVGEKE